MLVGKLNLNPAKNPAVLDTATWEPARAWEWVQSLDEAYWSSLQEAAAGGTTLPARGGLTPFAASCMRHQGALYCLAGLPDGQQVFLQVGDVQTESVLGKAFGGKPLSSGGQVAVHKTDASVIEIA